MNGGIQDEYIYKFKAAVSSLSFFILKEIIRRRVLEIPYLIHVSYRSCKSMERNVYFYQTRRIHLPLALLASVLLFALTNIHTPLPYLLTYLLPIQTIERR